MLHWVALFFIIYTYINGDIFMSWEQIATGLQLVAIAAIIIGSCLAPLAYTMWKERKNKEK